MGHVRNRHFRAWAADALAVTILELWARVGKSLRWFRGWREDYRESSKAAFGRPRGTQEEPKTSPRGSKRAQEEPKRKARAQEEPKKSQEEPKRKFLGAPKPTIQVPMRDPQKRS